VAQRIPDFALKAGTHPIYETGFLRSIRPNSTSCGENHVAKSPPPSSSTATATRTSSWEREDVILLIDVSHRRPQPRLERDRAAESWATALPMSGPIAENKVVIMTGAGDNFCADIECRQLQIEYGGRLVT